MNLKVSELERVLSDLIVVIDDKKLVEVDALVKKLSSLGVPVAILPDGPPPKK